MQAPDDWYRTFFHGVALDLWRAVTTPEFTRADADFLQKHLDLASHPRILDVPCGNGRLAIELAARGYQTAGVDLAEESVAEAKAEAARRGLGVTIRHGDMRELSGLGTFDGAVCWGNSFGYLDDQGNADFLRAAAGVLRPGGRFVLEFGTVAETIIPALKERTWYPIADMILAIENRYDAERGRLQTTYHFIRDGKDDVRLGSQQVFLFRELLALLRAAGFGEVAAYSSLAGEPLKLGGQRAIVVARRDDQ
jgi:SAM-dependent methyltransferase